MESFAVILLLLVCCNTISIVRSTGDDNGFLSFTVSTLTTAEDSNGIYTSVNIPFTRTGGVTGTVAATFRVINSSATDEFLSISNTAVFNDGDISTTGTLILINDAIPEGNETFVVEIIDARFGAELGSLTTLLLTIEASDEPYGRISFDDDSLSITDSEPLSGQSNSVQFQVNRGPGIFGKVTVNYKITAGPDLGMLDISPTEGQIVFNELINTSTIALNILPDNVPENIELFTISLYNPGGGALLADSNTQAQLSISANDVPVRFGSSITYVLENAGSLNMMVFRGSLLGGEKYGPLVQETTVTYNTTSVTATNNDDYTGSSGIITFLSGEIIQSISIPIIDDGIPEGDESFTITLSNPSSDSVLVNPSITTVIISINDNAGGIVRFQSTDTQTISEDDQTSAIFTIIRTNSTLGNLIIGWSILDNNNQLASNDFNPANGTVTLPAGDSQVNLTIIAFDDSVPEVAEAFTVTIDEIVGGGAKLDNETLRIAMLYVADSDNVYGLIEVNTGSGIIIVDGTQRILTFGIIRSGGLSGEITVEYRILYLPAGVTDITKGTSGEVTTGIASVTLAEGVASQDVNVTIFGDGFLDEGSRLYVEITGTQLTNAPPLVPMTSSPTVGNVNSLTATVPFTAASGFISFSSNSVTRTVQEPESGFETVQLSIFRGGTFGKATVTWTTLPLGDSSFTPADVLSSAAVVTINDGFSSATFDIIINADNIPELDEPFLVQLLSVTEFNQELSDTQTTATVTIAMNDNPEGTFVVADVSQGPLYITEDDPVTIVIQRNGGDLTEEQLQYSVTPNGDTEFFGSVGIITFSIGQSLSTAAVLTPVKDNIPEINETYTFQLSATNNDLIGEDSTVTITILANDDWNGRYSYDPSSLSITIEEPPNPGTMDDSLVTIANLTIIRNGGLFGEATVYWAVTMDTSDVTPTNGSVYFTEGQDNGWFIVSAVNDQITELDINHSIQLTTVNGGGIINDINNTAIINILRNDDPISFIVQDTFRLANEGDIITLQLIRVGNAMDVAMVTFNVTYQTGSSNDVIITPSNQVVFQDGDTSTYINITFIDDVIPELNENLLLTLTSTTGDAVIATSNFESHLTMIESDDPNGIFEFSANSSDVMINEGSSISLSVKRGGGSFGLVIVTWQLYRIDPITNDLTLAIVGDDFEIVAGSITFNEGDIIQNILLSVIDDNTPELEEMYSIVLVNVTNGRLGDTDTSLLTILESDDPYGLIVFINDNDIWIAEDIINNTNTNNTGVFNISRSSGTIGNITVIWEVHPISSPSLPSVIDIITEGTVGSNVQPLDVSRPYSETIAYNFTGIPESIITINSFDQLDDSRYFSLSVWVYLDTPTYNGIILAKSSSDGTTIYYGLGIANDNNDNNIIIRLYYLPDTEQVGFSTIEISISDTLLSVMDWHSVIVVVSDTNVGFYINGVLQVERTLTASINNNSTIGIITVGGLIDSLYFEGFLQDIRIYSSSLTQEQVNEIVTMPASYDLSSVTGSVWFDDGQLLNDFSISSLNDNIIEFTELFNVQLIYSNGGSRIDTNNTLLSVLKSDYSNGVFGFASVDIAPVSEENITIPILVTRERGVYSSVIVSWKVTLDGILADNDFVYSTGNITIEANETQEFIMLQVANDVVPELTESYIISLTTVIANDIYPSSQSFSGASINISLSQITINITENDNPYGIAQFAVVAPINDDIIPIDTNNILTINVNESMIEVTVFVVRASGTFGIGTVQYNTNDGTAISGSDYITNGGTLVFEDGVNVQSFTVTLIDNSVPELDKYFFINLTIPNQESNNIRLDVISDIIINILPSDDAFGIFSFTENSRSVIVDELQGDMSAILTIFRGSKGVFGDISVYWEVDNPTSDLTPTNGYINFTNGEISNDLTININNDLNPEFHEVFNIILVNTIGGGTIDTVGGANIAILTISASDYPYGLFSFPPAYRPLIVSETNAPMTVNILREFGKTGSVRVDYKTMMATELGDNYIATEDIDYISVSDGSVIFAPNVTSQSVVFNIIEDSIPELDEEFYIILTNATLIGDSALNLGLDGLPSIYGNGNNATIIIEENDNARGSIELTVSSYTVTEGSSNFITYNRTLGTLGDVQVSWMVIFDTAIPADVSMVTGIETISEGITTGSIDLTVINDNVPETIESFTVQLTSVSIGGQLGSLLTTTVTIEASDDPFGLFGFANSSQLMVLKEPITGSAQVILSIVRDGGTIGVTHVYWNITNTNNDIQPLEGTVMFLSGDSVKTITISSIADEIPELQESFIVTIQTVTSGTINIDSNKATIIIPANDQPYGNVSLSPLTISVNESVEESQSTPVITIQRTGNNLGIIIVYYTVRRIYPYTLDAFNTPINNISPLLIYKSFEISVFETDDVINECAVNCILAHSLCESFVIDNINNICEIYTQTLDEGSGNITRPNVMYYEAMNDELELIARHIATPDDDFQSVANGNITLTNEMNSAVGIVTILSDTVPELIENFTVILTGVMVANSDNILQEDLPVYDTTPLTVSILQNDDPFGRFTINSGQSQLVSVKEGTSATFTIEREGGSFGEASVKWNTTLVSPGLQLTELSGDLQNIAVFMSGKTKVSFSIIVNDDIIPEGAEHLIVYLSEPTGGAVLGSDNYTVVTMVIQANDGAAGSVGFAVNSRAVNIVEGENATLTVERSIGQSGIIRVYWIINETNAINEFEEISGTFLMTDGVNVTSFDISVKMDNSSELNEIFTVELTTVVAVSSDVGDPSITISASVSTLTVEASDNPYGEVGFSQNSLSVNVQEESPGTVTITRNFGSFNIIQVNYRALLSSNLDIPASMIAAAGIDFNDTIMSVELADGVTGVEIPVPILDDIIPEFMEFLSIEIISSFLLSDPLIIVPVGINNVSNIIINNSDNPNGIIEFENDTYIINEDTGIFSLFIMRKQGLIGDAIVNYQINHIDTSDDDFNPFVQSGSILFSDGVDLQVLQLFITNDPLPELDEMFCIEMFSSNGEVDLGDINTTCITIAASDDPNGVFSFVTDSLQATIEEATDIVNDNNTVVITVTRSGGLIGDVTVPYSIDSNDLSPNSGVLLFADGDNQKSFSLTAITDANPELDETHSVILGIPTSGRLNNINIISNITILANQDPYGILTLYTSNGLLSVSVEEINNNVTFEIKRSFPSFGNIMITFSNGGGQNEGSGLILDNIDYQELVTTITMVANQTSAFINLEIFDDDIPETDETFTAVIMNPMGGATLGDQVSVPVTILSNDDAHGIIGFDEDSLSVIVTEQDGSNTSIPLTIERLGGTIGDVTLQWVVTGQHSIGEITPTEGIVIFADGVGVATITLTLAHDNTPELNEVTMVTLTDITDNGVPEGGDVTRGATLINGRSQSVLTVTANDDPHGLFVWSSDNIDIEEPDNTSNIITVYILREFGVIGDVTVNYRTYTGLSIPIDTMATINEDYMNNTNTIIFSNGQTVYPINITVFKDDIPELTESFNISIDGVKLVNESDRQDSMSDSPRTGLQNFATINILSNDIPNGVLEFTGPKVVNVDENVGVVCLPVIRSFGTFGLVGANYIITNITANGGGVDYTPDTDIVQIDTMVDEGCVNITIINDLISELDESFLVTLVNPFGGVVLGSNLTITVIINKNDDINGVFTLSSDSLVLFVPEGDEVTLTIERAKGLVGVVTVYWVIEESGWSDLSPNAGNVTFQEGDTSKSFTLTAIEDGLPEVYESYSLFLSTTTGDGRITSPSISNIAIPASDEPNGIIGFISYSLNTIIVQEGDSFIVSVIRTGGLFGSVTMQWSLTPADTTVFTTVSATEEFIDGQSVLNFTVLTIQDSLAEVAKQYDLTITGSGDATINSSAANIKVIVAASDDVHGIVSFSSVSSSFPEDDGVVSISVLRTGGLVGDLRVNYTAEDREAFSPNDYSLSANSIIITDNSNIGTISVAIGNDDTPEINEFFVININSVELINNINNGRDFNYNGDTSLIDTLPSLGVITTTNINIEENDNARGVFTFTTNVITVTEGTTVIINIQRLQGTFGTPAIHYTVSTGTAQEDDYMKATPTSPIIFSVGQSLRSISIIIVDDNLPELQETLLVELTGINNGGILGDVTTLSIIIEPSDNPLGSIGFTDNDIAGRFIDNSVSPFFISLTIDKEGGELQEENIVVFYTITGPNPGQESTDIQSITQGSILIFIGQAFGTISVTFLGNTDGFELEENYTVTLTSVTSGVTLQEGATVATITVSELGQPYGVITFFGEALGIQITDESENISFPIIRNEGTYGTTEVFYTVTPSSDVSPVNGSLFLQEGQSVSSIVLQILTDGIPELNEQFLITLTSATGGTVIDSTVFTSSFIIEANESPYGTFGITNTSLVLYPVGGALLRRLSFTIQRDYGTDETVQVIISISYEPEPDNGYFPNNITRTFTTGQAQSVVIVDSTPDAFLAPNSNILITITNVELITNSDDNSNVLPEISPFIGSIIYIIDNSVANAIIGFSTSSIKATVIDGVDSDNVILTVERNGTVGGVQISWFVGTYIEGVVNGSLIPVVGSVMIGPNDTTVLLTFTATPTDPPSLPEVFAVNLFVQTLSTLPARIANERGVAIIEPIGVVKLRYQSFSEIEGGTVFMSVSRLYGSIGSIIITGTTMDASNSDLGTNELVADPITDYPLGDISITLSDGITTGNLLLILPYNSGTSPLKVFTFQLTSVVTPGQIDITPRLATPIDIVPVTIIDADGGSGIFEFINSTTIISEDGSPLAQALIRRTGGVMGAVTVQVSILLTRADNTTPIDQIASYNDFSSESLLTLVTFASNDDLKPVSIQILDDNVPEIIEYFTLQLENPQGGKAIINDDKSTFEVSINANDNSQGLFNLITDSIVLNEDDSLQGVLLVTRDPGLFGTVNINWRASYTDGNTHTVALGDLLVEDSGIIIFTPGQSTADLIITLQQDKVPLSSETFTITISSDADEVVFGDITASVTALPSGFSVFQFAQSSRQLITSPFTVTLNIERIKGLSLDTSIQYYTVEPTESVTIGQLTFEPALASSHFTLIAQDTVFFEPNQANQSIHIPIISTDDIARVFFVNIQAVGSDSVMNSQAIVIIAPTGILTDLYTVYFNAIDAVTVNSLYSVANNVKDIVEGQSVPGTDSTLSIILLLTLEEIYTTIVQQQISYSDNLQIIMSDIYQLIIADPTYSGRADVADYITSFGNSLLTGFDCNSDSVIISQSSYIIRTVRTTPTNLHTLDLRTTNNDLITLPNTNLEVTTDCVNVIFIAYSTSNLFSGPLLGDKVITLSLKQPEITRLDTPLTYRITSPNGNVFPSSNSCLIWRPSATAGSSGQVGGYWDSSICKLSQSSVIEMDHIDCECQSLGQFAVAPPPNYGWTIPGPISCAFVMVIMMAIIILHLYYFRRIQLGTRILVMLCMAIAIFELIALVDMVVSTTDISNSGCVAIGIIMHLSVVSVFVWLLMLVIALWLNLMGFTNGQEPLVIYIFISWGLSAAIVIATILSGIYALSWSLDQVYGRVGELCFIPSASVAGVSTALPIILSLLIAIGMLSHSCIYWTRWEDIKSLYKDTYNKRDIPLLLVLYSLIIFVMVFGGLHLYLQQIYLFFVFFGFNVILGIYSLVVYVFMSWHTLTWKHKHYPIKEEVQPLSLPEEPEFIPMGPIGFPDVYGSRQSLIPRYQDHPIPQSTIKSTTSGGSRPVLPQSTKPPSNRIIAEIRELSEPDTRTQSHVTQSEISGQDDDEGGDSESEFGNYEITQELGSDDESESQMDDLLYALKTEGSGFSASQTEGDDDYRPLIQEVDVTRRKKPSNDPYRMRRISIADTHI